MLASSTLKMLHDIVYCLCKAHGTDVQWRAEYHLLLPPIYLTHDERNLSFLGDVVEARFDLLCIGSGALDCDTYGKFFVLLEGLADLLDHVGRFVSPHWYTACPLEEPRQWWLIDGVFDQVVDRHLVEHLTKQPDREVPIGRMRSCHQYVLGRLGGIGSTNLKSPKLQYHRCEPLHLIKGR